jgi:guanylate kinase
MPKKGRLFVISGPSGVGKSTLVLDALSGLDRFKKSVSATTRPPRENEVNGKHYWFIKEEQFKEMISQGQFIEWANYLGYFYGTLKQTVEESLDAGIHIILEIEVMGAMQVKQAFADAYFIFITVTPTSHLAKRLDKRGTETKEDIAKRLASAVDELKYQKEYNCIIVNNNYNEALKNLKDVLIKEGGLK